MLNMIATRQYDSLTYAASTTQSMKLQAAGAVTRIVLRMSLNMSATLVAACLENGPFCAIHGLRVVGGGNRIYYSIGNDRIGRLIHWLNRHDGIVRGTGHQFLADPIDVVFVLHFGSRPQTRYLQDNPYDMSAFIPAFDDDELRLEWDTPAITAVDNVVTIATGTKLYATIYEALGSASDLRREMARQGVTKAMVPTSTYFTEAPGAAYTDYGREIDVPTGNYMRRIALMCHNGTALVPLRTDLEMTGIALIFPNVGQRLIADDFATLSMTQGALEHPVEDAATGLTGGVTPLLGGCAVLDLRQHGDPDYGLDLRNYKVGDVKTGATLAGNANYDEFYWYDMLNKYVGNL